MYFEIKDAYYHFLDRDYRTVFQIIGVVINAVGYVFIIFNYYKHKREFFEVLALLRLSMEQSLLYAPEIVRSVQPLRDKFAKRFLILSIFAYELMYVIWCSPPVVTFFARLPDVNYSTLPLAYGRQNYGLNENEPVEFWLIIVIQFLHGTACLTGICFGNTLTPILCILLGCQLDILERALTQVGYNVEAKSKRALFLAKLHSKNMPFNGGEMMEFKTDMTDTLIIQSDRDYLTQCIEHHQTCMRAVYKMRPILAPYLFVVLMTTIISVTNLMITTAMYQSDALGTIIIINTGVIFVSLLVIMTWSLTMVRSKLSNVLRYLYNSKWSQLSECPSRKQDFLIVSQSSFQPVTFPLIMYGNLDFPRLYQLFNLAWNYFSLMKSVAGQLKEAELHQHSDHIPHHMVT
ncbi:uncharacterized protein [Bemisia tabaci]